MKQLLLSDDANQSFRVILTNTEEIQLQLVYNPVIQTWILNVQYSDFIANGLSLVVAKNVLYQYSNLIPFGLLVVTNSGLDPMFLDDFTADRIRVYVFDHSEAGDLL